MTADEIVRKIAERFGDDPYNRDHELSAPICLFCGEYESDPHKPDCLWLEIEKHANRCTETTNVHGLSFQCILTQGHIAMHQCEGNSAKVDGWMVVWDADTTFYSNDPLVVSTDASVE